MKSSIEQTEFFHAVFKKSVLILQERGHCEHRQKRPCTWVEMLKIAIASDHAGYRYKEMLRRHLASNRYEIVDFGAHDEKPVDYPLFIRPAAEAVAKGDCDLGIVLGGSGNGEAIAANKVRGIRCAVCWNSESARLAREHNNANVISIGQRLVSSETAVEIVDAWLAAEFQGGRHARRISQIE